MFGFFVNVAVTSNHQTSCETLGVLKSRVKIKHLFKIKRICTEFVALSLNHQNESCVRILTDKVGLERKVDESRRLKLANELD